jgi:hypothetical protein
MKSLFTAILGSCLLLSTSAFAQIKVGDPEDKARSETPDYIGEYNKGSSKILYFKKGEVVITGGKVSKISWFKKKTKITELDGLIKDPAVDRAIRRKIRKFGGPLKEKDLEALRVLEINSKTKGRTRANSLIGLEGAVYLTRLQLSDNSLTNVNALTNLTLLRDLYFHGGTGIKDQSSPITDFGWLGGLTNLNTLYLNSLQIGNLAPLANLKNLRELTLINCGVRDANALAPLAGTLEKLVLSNNAIGNAASLTVFENVNALYLNHNQIGDVTPLGQMGGLNSLYLDGNPVRDITPLMTLPKLRSLSLMCTQLQIAADSEDRVNVNTLAARGVRVVFPPAPKPEPAPTPVAAPGTEGDSAP